ncbi:MAG: hypothetical protein NZ606_06220 [Candidatus Kapabacteria bacterium]|nr:hypothetical protein [Candidatus Kapabacteria bacterium]
MVVDLLVKAFIVAILAGAVAFGQSSSVFLWWSATRTTIPLSGQWQRSLDEGRSWQSVTLPRHEVDPVERILYRKALHLDSIAVNQAWQLCFGGVREALQLTINGQYVGRYFSGGIPFCVPLPRHLLRRGRNTIELSVTPASDESSLQVRMQWRAPDRPLGIVRPVVAVGSSPVFVERMHVEHEWNGDNVQLRVTAFVACQQQIAVRTFSIRTTLLRQGAVVASTELPFTPIVDRTLPVALTLSVLSPQQWIPGSPAVYELRVEIVGDGNTLDDLRRRIAFRSNAFARMLPSLRGVVYVDQWGRDDNGVLRSPDYEQDVRLLQQLGVNVVYCAWLPPSPQFVELCSAAGIGILLDLPFGDIPEAAFSNEELRTRAQNTAIRLRDAYSGEPSILGIVLAANVDLRREETSDYLRAIAPILPSLFHFVAIPAGHQVPAHLPIDGVFVSDQLLTRRREDIAARVQETIATLTVPWFLLGGALVQPLNRNGYADPLSMEAQAEYIGRLYRLSSTLGARGIFIRSFADYRTRYPILTANLGRQARWCTEGIVDTTRQRRLAFEMVRALNTGEQEPLLQAGSYQASTPYVFLAGGLGAIFLLFGLLNRSRRFREYMLRSLVHPHNFFTDVRDQRILLQGQTLLLALIVAVTYALVLGTLLYVTREDPAADYISNLLALTPEGKALYIELAWSPSLAVSVIVLLVLVKIILVSVVIRAIAALSERSVLFADALTLVVWSLVPIIGFLPIAMVLFRLLAITPPLVWFLLLGVVTIWCIGRLLRAVVIVFEAAPLVVYTVGIGSIAVAGGLVIGYLHSHVAFVDYLIHGIRLFFP